MSESNARRRLPSSRRSGTDVRKKLAADTPNNFGTVVRALWPEKPALNLAQRAGLSERGAQYLIDGKRKPNAHTMHILSGFILGG